MEIKIVKMWDEWEGQILRKDKMGTEFVATSYRAGSLNTLLAAINMVEGG